MVMLRTIGAYIDSCGIDMCWIESELYGPSTVKQILDGNHVKRGKKAHMITLQACMVFIVPNWVSWNFAGTAPVSWKFIKRIYWSIQRGQERKNRESPPVVGSISSSKVIEKVLEFDTANNRSPWFVYSDATPYVNDNGNVCLYQISSKR